MIIFSHGFGVQKDSRGMFSDIVKALGRDDVHLFDYNVVDQNGDLHVSDLHSQVTKLREELKAFHLNDVDLVCHSQGCLVAALLCPSVRSVILLAPATTTTPEAFAKVFEGRNGTTITFDGISELIRRDGTKTIVPKAYWDSLATIGDVDPLYTKLAKQSTVHVVFAGDDDVVGKSNLPKLKESAESFTIITNANHNFDTPARSELLEKVIALL